MSMWLLLNEQFFKYIMASISYISMLNVGGLPETVAFNSLRLKLYLFIIQWTFMSSFSLINIFLFDKMDLEVFNIITRIGLIPSFLKSSIEKSTSCNELLHGWNIPLSSINLMFIKSMSNTVWENDL
jgi:hypothetical protein